MSTVYSLSYTYQNQKFNNSRAVRNAIKQVENKMFGAEPKHEDRETQTKLRVDFWNGLGVQYSETAVEVNDPSEEDILQQAKVSKKAALEDKFNRERSSSQTYIESSLGFKANSNITAFNNIDGLIGLAGNANFAPEGTIAFMDFDNQPHNLTQQQLQLLKDEISAAASMWYQVKWQYRAEIEAATSPSQLNLMMFTFRPISFVGDQPSFI